MGTRAQCRLSFAHRVVHSSSLVFRWASVYRDEGELDAMLHKASYDSRAREFIATGKEGDIFCELAQTFRTNIARNPPCCSDPALLGHYAEVRDLALSLIGEKNKMIMGSLENNIFEVLLS